MEEDSEGQVGRKELLANIRRLTIAVLDNLEKGPEIRPWTKERSVCSAALALDCYGYGEMP